MKIFEMNGIVTINEHNFMEVNGVGIWSVLNGLEGFIENSGKKIKLSLVVEEDEPKEACNEQG